MSSAGVRYTCTLDEETLEKAIKELNEPTDNAVRLAEIDKLRTRFQEEQTELGLLRSDDAFILRFLRNKKFDHERAYQCLLKYHKERSSWPELFDLVNNPEKISDVLNSGFIVSIGQKGSNNEYVLIVRPGMGFSTNSDALAYMAAAYMSIERTLEYEPVQVHGVVIVEDLSFLSLKVAWKFMPIEERAMPLLQDATPVRIKSIHLTNEGIIIDALWAIVKRFMKEKIIKRIHFHGEKFDGLYNFVAQEHLPKLFAGTGPELDVESWAQELCNNMGRGEDTAL